MQLIDAPYGIWFRVTALDGGENLRVKLNQQGLFPGDRLRVFRAAPLKGPLLIEVNAREIALGRGVAAKIRVEAAE